MKTDRKNSMVPGLLLAILLLTVFGARSAAAEALPTETVIIATDLHYIAPELTDNGPGFTRLVQAADGKDMLRCETIIDHFMDQVIQNHPEALILAGDLSFNGEKASLLRLAEKLEHVREAGIRVFVIPGNHDLNYPMAASFSGDSYTPVPAVTGAEFSDIFRNFGYGGALARDPASLSYTAQLDDGIRLLMLDVNGSANPGACTEETLLWTERQLQQAEEDGMAVIAVSHQNLLQHSFLSYGCMMGNADALRDLYEEYGVLCNLSGHMHIQHIQIQDSGLAEIAGSALITAPNQFGVLRIGEDGISYSTERTETGCEVDSERFLRATAVRQGRAELEAAGIQGDPEDLVPFFADVNLAYIAGQPFAVDWADERYEKWKSLPSIVGYYMQTIQNESDTDHTSLTVPMP